jgi:zinc and cadmium transporter
MPIMVLVWALASTFLISIISLIGVFTLVITLQLRQKLLFGLIGFSAGALIGGAFLHLLPEALHSSTDNNLVFYFLIGGVVLFFLMERFLHWRHCHIGTCNIHAFTYLNLVGDSFHNFVDGLVVVASFFVSVNLGIATTAVIIFHEIPQELGDFGVLVYGGFSTQRALLYNFLTALFAIVGAIVGYFITGYAKGFINFILPVTAGGFIYIAASDLIPEIHKEKNQKRATLAFIAFLVGIVFMAIAKLIFPE